MKEQFVPHEIAILLKEKGFTDECMASYDISLTAQEDEEDGFSGSFGWEKGEVTFNKGYFANGTSYCDFSNEHWLYCAAPLWQQCLEWFEREHWVDFWTVPILTPNPKQYECFIMYRGKEISCEILGIRFFNSYNDARQTAVEKILKHI
jgi:hypothetical protein